MKTRYPLPSPLSESIQSFLSYHRALGKRFESEEDALRLLDRYLCEQDVTTLAQVTPQLLEDFLVSRPRTRARSYNHLLSVLDRLFRWLVAQEVLSCSPLKAHRHRTTQNRPPFLFKSEQVKKLLASAAALRDRSHAVHRGWTYRLIFAVMYGLGLRVSEVSSLCRKDLDCERQCLHIRQTKFLKSRLVPFGPRMSDALQSYFQRHGRQVRLCGEDPLFSLAKDGRQAIYSKSISRTFQKLVPELDLTVPPGVAPPRLHCLRHSCAVSILLEWYRGGIDPQTRLMYLSVLLGHVNPTSTAVYLTMTADLLTEANQRFERFAAPILKEV